MVSALHGRWHGRSRFILGAKPRLASAGDLPVGEMTAFDRRHKVFLAAAAMGVEVWAFRYKK
jgi:hypothetical protein